MRCSVIVPALNEADRIAACLADVAAMLITANDECIVVDGGSTDATARIAREQGARVIAGPRGRARQMNAGAAGASGEVLLFLHADTQLPVTARHAIDAAWAARGVRLWGRFDVSLDAAGPAYRIIETMMNLRSRMSGIATGDQAMFVAADLFHAAGGFADIALMEDIDLSRRLGRHARPVNLRARAVTSARRWQDEGVVRTVLTMWALRAGFRLGVSPERLRACYERRSTST